MSLCTQLNKVLRITVAVLASAASVLPIFLTITWLTGDAVNNLMLISLAAAFIFAITGVLLIGLPLHFFLLWVGRTDALYYTLVGFMAPCVITLIAHPFGEDGLSMIVLQAALMGCFGACVALIFWKIAVTDSDKYR